MNALYLDPGKASMAGTRARHYALSMLFVALCVYSASANADISAANILDRVQDRYAQIATFWAASIAARAAWLFWTLALISMVWTFGLMALRKADIAEFFAEFIRFTVFVGFFWWLLDHGPQFAMAIINSMRTIGSEAANAGSAGAGLPAQMSALPSPSGVMDVAFTLFDIVIDKSSVWSPFASAVAILITIIVLIVMTLIALNMLVLLVCGWMLAYAGIFFLGFGGSKWTSDFAIAYFRTVLNLAAQLMAMVLIVGAGSNLIITIYGEMSEDFRLKEMAILMAAAIVLLGLVNKVPGFVGGLASGGGTGALGGGFGAGSVVAAAAMAGAAVATAGAALATAAANVGGGAQALMAAFSKASQDAGGGSAGRDFLPPPSGASAGSGGSASSIEGSSFGRAIGASSNHSAEAAHALAEKSAGAAAAGTGSEIGEGSGSASVSSVAGGSTGSSTNESGQAAAQQPSSNDAGSSKTDAGSPDTASKAAAGSSLAKAAGKAGKIAAGTAGNLALGAFDVAKQGAHNLMDKASQRMSETIPGKVATAIKARQASSAASSGTGPANSISAGSKSIDREAEVAAFRDRKSDDAGDNA